MAASWDGYDHGHVVMKDGRELEFGFTPPTEAELQRCGGDIWTYATEVALDWVNGDGDRAYTGDDIERLQLAG